MVKAELSYNPYLLETKIKFNDKIPKVNSLAKKYQNSKLQDWIFELPKIFYNEMNGYDFDLDFSGTVIDFEELKHAFIKEGVKIKGYSLPDGQIIPADVRLFFRNELDSAIEKYIQVKNLLAWFEEKPNRRFDFENFKDEHSEFLDKPFSYLIINGSNLSWPEFKDFDVEIQNADNINELPQELSNMPIVFYIDNNFKIKLDSFIKYLSEKSEVDETQIFFMFSENVNKEQLIREVQDRWVKEPQLINRLDDEHITTYFELGPLAQYIYQSINIFQDEISKLMNSLDMDLNESQLLNKHIYRELDDFAIRIDRLKIVKDKFELRDNYEVPFELIELKQKVLTKINNWNKRKNKYVTDEDAKKAASIFQLDIIKLCDQFNVEIIQLANREIKQFNNRFFDLYQSAKIDDQFVIEDYFDKQDINSFAISDLTDQFLATRKEKMISKSADLSIFHNFFERETQSREFISEISYMINQWRQIAFDAVDSLLDKIINQVIIQIELIYKVTAIGYMTHLSDLIDELTVKKDELAQKLSAEERKLQEDSDWLTRLIDRVKIIEERID